LNKITHKFVLEKTKRLIESYEQDNKKAVVVDAPLLFEANFDKFCDFSIAVICDTSISLKRIMTRDSITEEAALMRINSQNPDDFYTTRAKYTVCNDCERQLLTCVWRAYSALKKYFNERYLHNEGT
jgi:dephospho-CoA kinase